MRAYYFSMVSTYIDHGVWVYLQVKLPQVPTPALQLLENVVSYHVR